ncbi:5'-nucleotidase domain-containing protein 3 isoform X2 [Cimex lectularius]|uniref:5'-nucleotidase domain-containing protein 3 n=1 Tax=Cimex lectularius TaxID=79782 RepID=A0A8I6R6I0_CIMLE|nr:5'-nucleotidase domain-containing protein 3 isoform X2 [Cimex lectularius]
MNASLGPRLLKACGKFLPASKRDLCTRLTRTGSLGDAYLKTKQKCESKKLPLDVDPKGVFACNELDLKEVNIYGFDYDYTLAVYKDSMDLLLYNLGRETLITKCKYPKGIGEMEYLPSFAIRGLHYDIEKGLLMKLDSFLQIQLGTVYRGLSPVPDAEVMKIYMNKTVPLAYVENRTSQTTPEPSNIAIKGSQTKNTEQQSTVQHKMKYFSTKMVQLADLFSVPEMCLLCNVTEYFQRNKMDYHPDILFRDIKKSFSSCHLLMHQLVQQDVGKYLDLNPGLKELFHRLVSAGKKLFLITNSPYQFVNRGMSYMVGPSWEEFFDLIIVQARKPLFFSDDTCPLRIYDKTVNTHYWNKVSKIEKGVIYYEGSLRQMQELTEWKGSEVLYFGDHPYSDLADVTLEHGWRTGAIIQELMHEIKTLNKEDFKKNCNWLQMLTQLIEEHQDSDDPEAGQILGSWMQERDKIRQDIKKVFNEQFGSVFRTYHNPTYFSRRLFRFADIYTSSVTNLLQHSVKHVFYPRRGVMPHEYSSYFV